MMNTAMLENGVKLIYTNGTSKLSSICISIDGGAVRDDGLLGIAHATEHFIYKGTGTRSEETINRELTELFPFQNAMTNYPYVIYYGSLLEEDLEGGIDLFADLLINPTFPQEGFIEEMKVIKEELNEWDLDINQFALDKLLYNSYNSKRIKYPIIGTRESLDMITLEDIKSFYNKWYLPSNATIAISTSRPFEEIKNLIEKYFLVWSGVVVDKPNIIKEKLKAAINYTYKKDLNVAKIKIAYDLSEINSTYRKALFILNEELCGGVDSVLFTALRTKEGLIYDITSEIYSEPGIDLYIITYTTSVENIEKSLEIYHNTIMNNWFIDNMTISKCIKSLRGKRYFKEEQIIQLVKGYATYSTMYNDLSSYKSELSNINEITKNDLRLLKEKLLISESIEIIRSGQNG